MPGGTLYLLSARSSPNQNFLSHRVTECLLLAIISRQTWWPSQCWHEFVALVTITAYLVQIRPSQQSHLAQKTLDKRTGLGHEDFSANTAESLQILKVAPEQAKPARTATGRTRYYRCDGTG